MAAHVSWRHIISSIVGTAEKLVIPASAMRARIVPASNLATGSTLPPLNSVGSVIWPRPTQWNSGAMQRALSVPRTSRWASWLTVFQVRLPWVRTAAFGRPVVPEV